MKKWSCAEEIILKKNYNEMPIVELANLFPGRTYSSVSSKARHMGLKKYNNGVKFIHNNGYVVVRYDDYPKDWCGAWKRSGWGTYVYEHSLEWYINHPDLKIEYNDVIHHIDGDKTNNDIGNLCKMTRSDHSRKTMLADWIDIPGVEAMQYHDMVGIR